MSIRNKIRTAAFLISKRKADNKILELCHCEKEISYLTDHEKAVFRNNFEKALKVYAVKQDRQDMMRKIVQGFYESKITELKKSFDKSEIDCDDVILVTVVKNDLLRSKLLFEYYRRLGVSHFIVLDNGSNDGTTEWLKEQKDINLYSCETPYETYRKEAWVNRLISTCGFNKWYLIVDSDELIDFAGSAAHSIIDLARELKRQGCTRGKGMLIDMYSRDDIFSTECEYQEIPKIFRYFDSDSYTHITNSFVDHWEGGPRERTLGTKNIWVSKSPLVYYDEKTLVVNAHFQFPLEIDRGSMEVFFIKHYKYLKRDYKPFLNRVNSGNFANGSDFYKNAVEKYNSGESVNFNYTGTQEYTTADSIIPGFYNLVRIL